MTDELPQKNLAERYERIAPFVIVGVMVIVGVVAGASPGVLILLAILGCLYAVIRVGGARAIRRLLQRLN